MCVCNIYWAVFAPTDAPGHTPAGADRVMFPAAEGDDASVHTPRSSPSNRNCLSFSVNHGRLSNYSGCCVVVISLGDQETRGSLVKTNFFSVV